MGFIFGFVMGGMMGIILMCLLISSRDDGNNRDN